MAELKKWGRNEPISANRLNEIQKSIYNLIQGGKGINVTTQGNKIILELSGKQRLPLNVLGDKLMVPFINDSGEEIPANSFVHITGVDADTLIVTCDKPDADSITADNLLIVTGAVPSLGPDGEAARSFGWPAELGKQWVAIEDGGTEATNGDTFGTVEDEWYGEVDKTGFTALGGTEEAALVSPFRSGAWRHAYIDDCETPIIKTVAIADANIISEVIHIETDSYELLNPITINGTDLVGLPLYNFLVDFTSTTDILLSKIRINIGLWNGSEWVENTSLNIGYGSTMTETASGDTFDKYYSWASNGTSDGQIPAIPTMFFRLGEAENITASKIRFCIKGQLSRSVLDSDIQVTVWLYSPGNVVPIYIVDQPTLYVG